MDLSLGWWIWKISMKYFQSERNFWVHDILTLNTTTFNITTLITTLRITILSLAVTIVQIFAEIFVRNAECHCTECHCAVCRYANCGDTEILVDGTVCLMQYTICNIITHADWLTEWWTLRACPHFLLAYACNQGILKGEVSLYCWPPVWLVWISLFCK